MGWIGSMTGGITGGIGGIVTNVVGAVVGGVRNALTTALRAILGTATGLVLGAFQALATGLVAIVGMLGVSVAGLTAVTLKARDALTAMARSIVGLQGATGMSAGRAGGLINRFNAFGISPDQTAAMFENSNPITMAMRARMMGARSFDAPGAIPAMAQRFQSMSASGPFGNRMARNFLGDFDTAEFRRVLMQPIAQLRQQEAFQNRLQGGLGVDPAMIARVGQQTEMLTNQFRLLGDTALIYLANRVLPYLNQRFEQATNWILSNADAIADGITRGVDFLINGAESVFNFFSNYGPAIAKAAQSAFTWIVNDLPPMLMRGGAFMLNTFASMLDGVANFSDGLIQNLPTILSTLDILLNGMRVFAGNFVGLVAGFLNRIGMYQPGSATSGAPRAAAPTTAAPRTPGIGETVGALLRDELTAQMRDPFGGGTAPGQNRMNFLPGLVRAVPQFLRLQQARYLARGAARGTPMIPVGRAPGASGIGRLLPLAGVTGAAYMGGQYLAGQAGGWMENMMGPAGMQARDDILNSWKPSNLAGQQAEIEALMRRRIGNAHSGANWLRERGKGLESAADNWPATLAALTAPNKNDPNNAPAMKLVIEHRHTYVGGGKWTDEIVSQTMEAITDRNYLDHLRISG